MVRYLILLCLLVTGCASPVDPRLQQGNRFVAHMVRKNELRRLGTKDGKVVPTLVVSAMFSDMGAAMWPVKGDFPEGEQPKNVVMPPEGISIVAGKPTKAWSIGVSGDDARQVIVVEGYGENLSEPVLRNELPVAP